MRPTAIPLSLLLLASALPLRAQEAAAPRAPARIEITPERVETIVGDTVRLEAALIDSSGRRMDQAPRWYTSYEIGSIDSTGAFVAARQGENQIVAVAPGNVTATVPVVVSPLPASEIELRLPATTMAASGWMPLAATATNRIGRLVFDPAFAWESSDPAVGSVIGGWLVARRPGTTTLTARSGDATASQTITVQAAPRGELTLDAPAGAVRTGEVVDLAPRIGGRALPPHVFPRWTLTGPDGRVYPDGAFVGDDPGDYLVVADFGGRSATALVHVEPRDHDKRLEFVGRGAVSYAHTGDLWVFDDVAYVGNFGDNSMRVFDVSDPARPVLTDSIVVDARRVNDVKVNVDGGFAVITREGASDRKNGIVILDIADPRHPTIASEYTETLTGGVHNTFIVGDLVYAVNDGTRDLHVIDVSDRDNPKQVGRWGLDNPDKVLHDVFVKDGIAYLSYWDDGLVILDLGGAGRGGTPTAPAFVSRVYYPEGNTHVAWRWKDYVFVGDEIFPQNWDSEKPIRPTGYIHVFDVKDLEHPVEVAKYEVPEAGAHNVWIEDDDTTLYVGYYNAGLRAVDVSGELRGDLYREGREVDHYFTGATENAKLLNAPMNWGPMIHDGKIYSADFNSGLWIHQWVPKKPEKPIS